MRSIKNSGISLERYNQLNSYKTLDYDFLDLDSYGFFMELFSGSYKDMLEEPAINIDFYMAVKVKMEKDKMKIMKRQQNKAKSRRDK